MLSDCGEGLPSYMFTTEIFGRHFCCDYNIPIIPNVHVFAVSYIVEALNHVHPVSGNHYAPPPAGIPVAASARPITFKNIAVRRDR
jgi:hypothetical protein